MIDVQMINSTLYNLSHPSLGSCKGRISTAPFFAQVVPRSWDELGSTFHRDSVSIFATYPREKNMV